MYASLPSGEPPYPAILVVPPMTGNGEGAIRDCDLKSKLEMEQYAFFSVDYSSTPSLSGKQFPLPLREIKAALRFLRGWYGEEMGLIDTTFIAISGFSLGGYVAAMMGVTRNIDSYTIGSETWDFESSDYAGHIFSSLSSDLRGKALNFLQRIRAAKQKEDITSPSLQGRSGEASKVLRDGQLLILRGDKTYTVTGIEVK